MDELRAYDDADDDDHDSSASSPAPSSDDNEEDPAPTEPPPAVRHPAHAPSPSPDALVVHVQIPVQCEQRTDLSTFLSAVHANTRLLFVGHAVKPALSYAAAERLHVSVTRATALSGRVAAALRRSLVTKVSTLSPFILSVPCAPFRSFVGQSGASVFVAVPLPGRRELQRVMRAVADVYAQYGLQALFDNPEPHMSVASTPNAAAHGNMLCFVNDQVNDIKSYRDATLSVHVTYLDLFVGKFRHRLPLARA